MLNKFIQALCIVFIFVSLLLVASSFYNRENTSFSSKHVVAQEVIYEPARVVIPTIDVDVKIEPVGKDKQGNMDVPSNYKNAGWWEYGAKPGEMGSAVIAGHVDTPLGERGIFYNIVDMAYGDKIFVYDSKNNKYTFQVTEIIEYESDEFPIDLVFTKNDGKRLNLITCAGVFDLSAQNYDKRTVVYARMVE